jgi:hypothetical protein
MKQNRHEIEFVGGRFAGKEQRRTDLGGHPEIDHPNLTRIGAAHLRPPSGQASGAVECGLVAEGDIGVLISDFKQSLANSPTLSFAQLWEFLDDFRCAHGEIIASVGNLSGKRLTETFLHESAPS